MGGKRNAEGKQKRNVKEEKVETVLILLHGIIKIAK